MYNIHTFKNSVTEEIKKKKKSNSFLLKLMHTLYTEDITKDKKKDISYKGGYREMFAEKRSGKVY